METLFERSPSKLNHQQLEMLRLLDKPLPESDYAELKDRVVQLLAKQIDEEMDRLDQQHQWNEGTFEEWGKEHNRANTK